jgi:ABC-type antimicrobial peptide transport system permease subunit
LALEPGAGSGAVPVRSAIAGVAIALTVIVSTLTFGTSLNSLASHPALYGWNWNYEFSSSGFGYFDIPQGPVDHLLAHDHYVAAWAGVYFGELQIDGLTEPVIGTSPTASVGPPILSGHALNKANQVVLGTATLAQLHKRVGDMVEIKNGFTAPTRLRIVGTATLPTVGQAGSLHTTMGTGALLSYEIIPVSVRNPFNNPVAGPQAIWVRLQRGANPTAALRSLHKIVVAPSVSTFGSPSVLSVQRPAQIVNYRSMGTAPALLSSGLAGGAVAALGLTLVASVRRRRRELAVLKALGFTQRQLAIAVAWQASVAAVAGSIVGVPLGIFLGRFLWYLFARGIHVVPVMNVPTFSIALVAVGGLVLANLVAFVPGRVAARTPTALLLQAE